jgi:hypothetical protein
LVETKSGSRRALISYDNTNFGAAELNPVNPEIVSNFFPAKTKSKAEE